MKNLIIKLFTPVFFISTLLSYSPLGQTAPSINTQSSGLALSATHVTTTDKLTLSFPKQHPAKLAIKDPNGIWFVIHEAGVNTRLMTDKIFKQATAININVSSITGVTWIDGKRTELRVFTVPGEYMVYMADNLETEPENTFYMTKTVTYKK